MEIKAILINATSTHCFLSLFMNIKLLSRFGHPDRNQITLIMVGMTESGEYLYVSLDMQDG